MNINISDPEGQNLLYVVSITFNILSYLTRKQEVVDVWRHVLCQQLYWLCSKPRSEATDHHLSIISASQTQFSHICCPDFV